MIAKLRDRRRARNGPSPPSQALRDEAGATLIEVALAMPAFFMLLFGLINFALVLFGFCNVTYASRSAGRYASLHSGTSNPDTTVSASTTTAATASAVNAIVSNFIFPYPANTFTSSIAYVQYYGSTSGNVIGNAAEVTVTITYTIVLPFFTYHGPSLTATGGGIIVQ